MDDKRRKDAGWCMNAFAGADQNTFGVLSALGDERNNRNSAGCSVQNTQNFVNGFGAVDDIYMSLGAQAFESKFEPIAQSEVGKIVRCGFALVGRGHIVCGIGRIGDDVVIFAKPRGVGIFDVAVDKTEIIKTIGGGTHVGEFYQFALNFKSGDRRFWKTVCQTQRNCAGAGAKVEYFVR